MKINLEQLPHQDAALQAIMRSLTPIPSPIERGETTEMYANPLLNHTFQERNFIDCKMETGTGKTYVYTRLMYELHKHLGLFKFVIVVPSLAIKEGTKAFIQSDYARRHFAKFYQNTRLELQVLNAGDFDAKKGRKAIPSNINAYCEATRNELNTIQCLLISDKGHLDKAGTSLFKDDYDQTLFGACSCPADGIKQTRPIVIIDEPHRLKRTGKSYRNIIERFAPQMIVRFGATFPIIGTGADKGKTDYYRGLPCFNLGAVESFNQGLVKAVDISFPNISDTDASNKYRVEALTSKELTLRKGKRDYEIKAGETLPADFEGGITYNGGKDKTLSNDLELHAGMDLIPGTFADSYQERLLKQAIDAHFKKETENFFRTNNSPKIKTISLFFIDSISSYRDMNGWLKTTFVRLLNEKLDELIAKYPANTEYDEFLQATKKSLCSPNQQVHAGYFAEDRGKGDAEIRKELDDILRNKEQMLSFKDEQGAWNTRRFLFSKWTLREGWDNPNVFVICKLRTSGSETSKIQEVGRGLRLPVDERGNRLSNEEFRLNYIIGWDEKEFAHKLVGEINSDAKVALNTEYLTHEMIKIICDYRNITKDELLEKLFTNGIIKIGCDFKEDGYEHLLAEYPELLQTQLQRSKVTAPNMHTQRKPIKLRTENWKKIAGFWKQVSKRYMLSFNRIDNGYLESIIDKVLAAKVFALQYSTITTLGTKASDDGAQVALSTVRETLNADTFGVLPYGEFIKRLHQRTFIPVKLLHEKVWAELVRFSKTHGYTNEQINEMINEQSLNKFITTFEQQFNTAFAQRYKYSSLDYSAETSVMNGDDFVQGLAAGLVETNEAKDLPDDDRNLYEPPLAYDSELEHKILQVKPNEKVVVYGKLPRKSIMLPTYTGGTTSPDFVYAIKKDDSDEISLHLVVEVKSTNPRLSDIEAVEAQKKAIKAMNSNIEWRVETNVERFASDLTDLLK